MERKELFEKIKKAYDGFEAELKEKGQLPMGETSHGFWGATHLNDIYEFFDRISLKSNTNFLDLGSGDGRVVLVASLFTNSTGVEADELLVKKASEIRDALGLKAEFIKDDYFNVNLQNFDFIFMFPDSKFDLLLENKFEKELKKSLWTYTKTYEPHFLEKERVFWVNQTPITEWKVPIPK